MDRLLCCLVITFFALSYAGWAGEMHGRGCAGPTPRPSCRWAGAVPPTDLATGETTGGDFGLYRWEMAGPPSGPAPHFHRSITESFYVLSGTVGLYDGSGWTDAGPGDFFFVPARRHPRLPQRARGAGLDAAAVHPGRAAGGLLRDARRRRPPRRDGPGRLDGVLPPPRHLLGPPLDIARRAGGDPAPRRGPAGRSGIGPPGRSGTTTSPAPAWFGPCSPSRMAVPQRRHGWPRRPYT